MNDVEARLARLSREGDRHAFIELVDLYKNKLFHLAYRMLRSVQEAEDIVQETFIRVYSNLNKYDESLKFSTWIFRIATNLCIDQLRKRKTIYSLDADVSAVDGTDWYAMMPSREPTPEMELMVSETKAQILQAIDSLPEKYKTVTILRYLHDLSLQEIGEVLQLPITTIKTRLFRGREHLRAKLNDYVKLSHDAD